ncbi:MAG TPA: allantoinase [Solibacterales bacterium]|nr:allantoinase [Bryobacterales bacterium]
MSKLALVYGLRLLPEGEIESVGAAEVRLKNGRTAQVTMHLMEGDNEEEIRAQLNRSLDAFFEFYPEV